MTTEEQIAELWSQICVSQCFLAGYAIGRNIEGVEYEIKTTTVALASIRLLTEAKTEKEKV